MDDDQGRYADTISGQHEALDSSSHGASEFDGGASRGDVGGTARPATRSPVARAGYFIDGAEAFAAVAVDRWLDLASARAGQRVVVGGSRLTGDGVGSYWWQAEDVIGTDGRPVKHPTATHWRR